MSQLIVDPVMLREPRLLTPNSQPLGRVKLDKAFNKKYCDAFIASSGALVSVKGNSLTINPTSPLFSGSRFSGTPYGMGFVSYANDGGEVDDKLKFTYSMPTAIVNDFTTILLVMIPSIRLFNMDLVQVASHRISYNCSYSLLTIGYQGGNGYDRYCQDYPISLIDKLACFVISTSYERLKINIAVNGIYIEPNMGQDAYIGSGTHATIDTPLIGSTEWDTHYNFNGYVYLWGVFPGVYISAQEAVSISINPYKILIPA